MMYQRIKGLLIGCAYGDAMGMPSEMMTRETMKKAFPNGIHSFMPSSRYDFIGRNLEAGKVTDDTINTLLVWKSIVENHGIFNVDVYLSLLQQWISVHQEIAHLIMGPSTLKALNLIEKGIPLSETGKFGTTNGACMKVSGIGVINDYRELHKLIKEVEKLCLPTHNSTIAIMGASVIAAIVSYVIRGGKDIEAIWDIAYQAIEMSKNMEILSMTKEGIRLYNIDQDELETEFSRIDWDTEAAEKNGFEHFMLKEIHEQPKAVRDTLNPRIKDKQILLDELKLTDEEICGLKRIQMVACGSAYHVCMSAKYIFEQLARIPVDVDLASEMRYRNPVFEDHTLAIVVSQSGETADTLAALREARNQGLPVMGIVNVVGSSIAREADHVFYTWAGPEIAVATTKAYSCQLIALYLLAVKFARAKEKITDTQMAELIEDLKKIPDQVEMLLGNQEKIQKFANRYLAAKDVFFIGRGIDYAISLEGSLKLKEISYIHSEAYAAGELKHGTISLIEDGTLVVALATQPALFQKTISNMVEVKARGAFVMAVTIEGNKAIEKAADYVVYIPETNPYFTNSLAIIPLQLFAYYVAVGRGCDVDKPRNLAKSVTVE